LIKHGVCQCLLGNGADFSGDAVAEFMDGIQGGIIEDGFLSAGQFEMVGDIEFAFLWVKSGHVVSNGDTLVKRFHYSELHDSSEVGLSCQNFDVFVKREAFEPEPG
jgi:hypothetical protein